MLAVRTRRSPFCGRIHNAGPRESEPSLSDPSCPSKSAGRKCKRLVPCRLNFGRPEMQRQRCCRRYPFFSRFHSQAPRVQTIQRPAARRSSASRERPYAVLVPPTSRAPSKKADLGTWELSHTRALRVVCLERLRASKELFRCMTIP